MFHAMRRLVATGVVLGGLLPWALAASSRAEPAFYASDFLETVAPGRARSSRFPERITLRKEAVPKEDLDALFSGTLRTSIACDGRPLADRAAIESTPITDGYYKNRLLVRFESGLPVEFIQQKGLFRVESGEAPASRHIAIECTRDPIQEGPAAGFTFHCRKVDAFLMGYYAPLSLFPGKVVETGEAILLSGSGFSESEDRALCPNGSVAAVYSLIPTQ